MKSCFECNSKKRLTNHHVVPRVLGGKNTVPLCSSCHGKVHNRKSMSHSALTKAGLTRLRNIGKRFSRTPLGFDLAPDGKYLIDNLAEQKVIDDILEMRAQGMSFPKIAKALTDRGVPTKRGGAQWNQATINGLVRRHKNTGSAKNFIKRRRTRTNGGISERRKPKD